MNAREILQHRFPLAPMDGFTHSVFRRFMRRMGCGFVVSEFVPASEIRNHSKKTKERIRYREEERPFGIQLYGSRVDEMVDAAREVEQLGADFVDFNFGCPVRGIVSKGKGAAWLCEPAKIGTLVSLTKKTVHIPVSIKIRTGFDQENASDVIQEAEAAGVDWIVVHGRTRTGGYTAPVNWPLLSLLRRQTSVPVIPNGDITTRESAYQTLTERGFSNFMVGRGALLEPTLFLELRNQLGETLRVPSRREILASLVQLLEEEPFDAIGKSMTLAKLTIPWAAGYVASRDLRIQAFALARQGDFSALFDCLGSYFDGPAMNAPREAVTNFMKAGHG